MASLRSRLLAAVLALTAAGLLVAGGVTYTTQRSFLFERLDQQVRSAPGAVAVALARQGVGAPPDFAGRPLPSGGPGGGGGPPVQLPPGTYGERRSAGGRVLGSVVLSYGQTVSATPDLPASLALDAPTTVDGRGRDAPRYRALAVRDPGGGGTLVVAVPLHEVDQTLHRLLLVEGLVIAGVLLAVGLAAWLVVRVGLAPLDRMGHTAARIAGGDLAHRVESADPRSEVGRLGIALNGMLDRLEDAFSERRASEDRLRRFLADASHELRTPLSAIRGYAELFRIGAHRDSRDTAKAMRRIEDEAARMGVLVEDLLTLARLDEIRDARHADVDLAALARDAVDDAHATAPERAITLRANGPAVVAGDAHQLCQVLANLLRNALVHTPAGTPIDVAVDAGGADEVRVAVRDHGPGLPGEDPSVLFERFWRAEHGRARGRSGAGLGLAIVAAIAAAHGGRVDAANAPGGGAAFVLHLPRARRTQLAAPAGGA